MLSCRVPRHPLTQYFSYFLQIVDLSLILKDNAPSKTVNPDDEFADNLWDSEEQKAEQEEEDPFWK